MEAAWRAPRTEDEIRAYTVGELVVADSADEAAYVPALEAAGYVLRIREPD